MCTSEAAIPCQNFCGLQWVIQEETQRIAVERPGAAAGSASATAARLQDLHERPPPQLVHRQPGGQGLFLREGAAVDAAQEEVEQALAGGGVVEDVADQSRLGRLGHEVL